MKFLVTCPECNCSIAVNTLEEIVECDNGQKCGEFIAKDGLPKAIDNSVKWNQNPNEQTAFNDIKCFFEKITNSVPRFRHKN